MDRFSAPYDAVLHLLDRQVIDSHGLLVCKVDDLALVDRDDGLAASALLAGLPALLPRLAGGDGGWALSWWGRLGLEQTDRLAPWRIDFGDIESVGSAVHLSRGREGLLRKTRPTHRLGDLLAAEVRTTGPVAERPEHRERVLDVRLDESQRVTDLLIGPGRPGGMLGYDRERREGQPGPAIIRGVVRRLHRHARFVPIEDVRIDWSAGAVVVDAEAVA